MSGVTQAKLLLVDDLDENLLALEVLLRRPEVEILKARSGAEALELLLVHEVALALVDVQMPEMDGFELATLMRGTERTRYVPIIFVTAGMDSPQHTFQAYDSGAVDFLTKPLDPVVLKHKTETFFLLDRQRRQLAQQLELLQASEEFRTRMIESSQDHLAVLHKDGTIATTHGSAVLPHTSSDWVSIWVDEAKPMAHAAIVDARKGHSTRFSAVARDRVSEWDVAVSPIRSPSGEIERLLAVARNVTSQRLAERERERLNDELKKNLYLNEMFVAAMTHDMRNPLNVIQLGVGSLEHGTLTPRQQQVVARVRSANERLTRMLSDLFDLARARLGGGIPIDRVTVDAGEIADKIVQSMEPAAKPRKIELQREGNVVGDWDGTRIEQVLCNLIGNAIEHGDPERPIQVTISGSTDELKVAVHNAGVVPVALRDSVFEPFRSGRNRGGTHAGIGLGLYIVRQIALAHGGQAVLRSADDEGTTLSVNLPRLQKTQPALATEQRS